MDEFRMRGGSFYAFVSPFVMPLAIFFPVCLGFGAILTGSTLWGAVIGVAGTGALVGVLAVRYRRMVESTTVRISPQGVELSDTYGFRLRLKWADIERVDTVASPMAGRRALGRSGGARVRTGAMQSVGLVGWGVMTVPSRIPRWLHDHLAGVPVHPESGLRWLGIPLGAVDPQWERGAMGELVRRHRPDLLA